jgi:uncharacterized protein (TIGR02001 family)
MLIVMEASMVSQRTPRTQVMGITSVLPALAATSMLVPIRSPAQDSWGGTIGVTSDYRVRGISQTRGEPALQIGMHARSTQGWLAGIWASTINRNRGASATAEIDAYLGFSWAIAPDWDARAVLTHYAYPNDPAHVRYDYDELSASITFRSQLAATVSWSPNTTYFGWNEYQWQAQSHASASYEITGLQPLTESLSATAGIGYNDLSRLFDHGYWYWNAGLSYGLGSVRVDVSHIGSDSHARQTFGSELSQAGWSAAISWRF